MRDLLLHESLCADPPNDPCVLAYSPTGRAWLLHGPVPDDIVAPSTSELATDANPQARFTQLSDAVASARAAGYAPTHWVNPATGVVRSLHEEN